MVMIAITTKSSINVKNLFMRTLLKQIFATVDDQ